MNILDKCKPIRDTESGRILLYRDELEAVLTTGDTISRQEAIRRAVEISLYGKKVKVVAVSELKALPSAQPQDIARDIANIIENEKDMRVIVKNAQPEIIRCKDCRNNHWCNIQEAAMAGDNFFCGAAERRTDGRFNQQAGGD